MAEARGKDTNEWRNQRSQEQLAIGGLPLNAEFRLRRLMESRRLFTSFLSVDELAVTSSLGVHPLGQVLGHSTFHVGWKPQPMTESMELIALSHAHNHARRSALKRMQLEAEALGARAVLGVKLSARMNKDDPLLEVSASGTAVTWPEEHAPGAPALCGITGQELRALWCAGYWPVGMTLGTCVYYQVGSTNTTSVTRGGLFNVGTGNQELTDYTRGYDCARQLAAEQMKNEAWSVQAEGVVGLTMDKTMQPHEVEIEMYETKIKRRNLMITINFMGTAISPFTERTPPVYPVMSLGT